MSIIGFAHYVFQFHKNGLLDVLADGPVDRMENRSIIQRALLGWIGQAVTGAIKPLVDPDASQIKCVINDETGKADQPIRGLDELDVYFGYFHYVVPFVYDQFSGGAQRTREDSLRPDSIRLRVHRDCAA